MNSVQKYGDKYHDAENMISQLSQNDFSVENPGNHVLESISDTCTLTDMITVQDPEDQTVFERQQTFTNYFHELKNQFVFTDHEDFKSLMSNLTNLQSEALSNQQKKRKKNCDEEFAFPNTMFGKKDHSKCE